MSNSFTRPPRVLGGNKQTIKASDFNALSRAIEELQNTLRPQPKGGREGASRPPFWTAISQVPKSDPATYQVTVTLGYLTYQSNTPLAQASDLGVTGWIVPMIAGVSLEAPIPQTVPPTTIPKLPLPAVESWVYLRVKTDADGCPKDGEVTVEAFDGAQESIHHHRLNPLSSEQEGDYFFLILKTKADESTPDESTPPRPIAERRITGNREMPNQLVENLNVGDKREWYKGYLVEDDRHEWRTAEQIESRGEPIILPLEEGEDEGDTLKWKRIAKNESKDQIQVSTKDNGTVIEIEGNGYEASGANVRKFSISVRDGLVESFTKEADGDGWWGTVQWVDLSSSGTIIETFEAGVLTRVQTNQSGGMIDVTGTQAAPGSVSREF